MLKQVHPDTGISSKAMSIMNSFINVSTGDERRRRRSAGVGELEAAGAGCWGSAAVFQLAVYQVLLRFRRL